MLTVPSIMLRALRECIRGVFETLLAARLLEYAGWGRYSLTPRGERVLRDHPWGVDSSVLEAFPEYLPFLRQKGQKPGGRDPVGEPKLQHSEGYAAFISGKGLDANPYEFDSAAHLEWENGWGEASKTRSGACRNQEPM